MLVSLSFGFRFNINIYFICIVLQFHNIPSKLYGNESSLSWSFLEVFKLNEVHESVCMSGYDNRHTYGRQVNAKYFTKNKMIELIKLAVNY